MGTSKHCSSLHESSNNSVGPKLAGQYNKTKISMPTKSCSDELVVVRLSKSDSKVDFESTICHRRLLVNG